MSPVSGEKAGEKAGGDTLAEIGSAALALEVARIHLHTAVTHARAAGVTWARIGEHLGISRQAAYKRFGRPVDPRSGAPMNPRNVGDLTDRTEAAFWSLAAGEVEELRRQMSTQAREVLTAQDLLDTWSRAIAETGVLERAEHSVAALADGTVLDPSDRVVGSVVVATTLECEAGEWHGRIAWDADGAIAGLLVVAPSSEPWPF